jgi:hypothetical protein
LKILQQIKAHIRTEWLIPLNINQETGSELAQYNNQQRLDEWQHVALVLDRLFFLLFSVAMPCTALLFVSAHLSHGNNFQSNLTDVKPQIADAKCDLIYKPVLT